MLVDLVLEPFGGDASMMVDVVHRLDEIDDGIDGIWVYDHFTAMMSTERSWSRDPFVLLGAYAATTKRVRLGTLVANVYNRHVVQLASAFNTVQSLADRYMAGATHDADSSNVDTRVVCGLGSGAAPGTRFAAEHEATGVVLDSSERRRVHLIETANAMRTIWAANRYHDAADIVETRPPPPIVFGASGAQTVLAATAHADGVNIRDGANVAELVSLARGEAADSFEISVLTALDPTQPLGTDIDRLASLGVDRVVLGVRSPFDPDLTSNMTLEAAARLRGAR